MVRAASLVGDVDGANDLFMVPSPYVPGSLYLVYNGDVVHADDDNGFVVVPFNPHYIKIKFVPRVGDVLLAMYVPV